REARCRRRICLPALRSWFSSAKAGNNLRMHRLGCCPGQMPRGLAMRRQATAKQFASFILSLDTFVRGTNAAALARPGDKRTRYRADEDRIAELRTYFLDEGIAGSVAQVG